MRIEPIIIPVEKVKKKVKKPVKRIIKKPVKKMVKKPVKKVVDEIVKKVVNKKSDDELIDFTKPVSKKSVDEWVDIKRKPVKIIDEDNLKIKEEEAKWSKGPKPSTKAPPEPQYALEPTPEELRLMKQFQSDYRKKNILKPTPEEEKIMEHMREPDLKSDFKPTPEELRIMEEEGVVKKQVKNRTKTGIEGIDELTKGGLPSNKCIAVVGGPGTGKSIMLMQFLVNGASKYHEAGIYITFEENVDELRGNYKNFNFNIEELEKKGLLKIVHYSPMKIKRFVRNMDVALRDMIKGMNAKRIVIDSLSAFTLMYNDEGSKREGLFQLFKTLKDLGVTALLSTESWREPTITKSGIIEFIADGVIILYNLKIGDTRVRAVEILKMRGIDHEARIVPFKISEKGIKVFVSEEVFGDKKDFSKF